MKAKKPAARAATTRFTAYRMWMVKTRYLAPWYGITYRKCDLKVPKDGKAVRVTVTEI